MTNALPHRPAVSIIVPVHNAAAAIAETLASVFAQTRHDFEIIVIDDGSEDAHALHATLAPWRDGVRMLTQPRRGAAAARNLGVVHARARLLAFLDTGDAWEPELLHRQLTLLHAIPELDLVCSDGWMVGDTLPADRTFFDWAAATAPPSFPSLVRQTCAVLTSSVVARTSVIRAANGFNTSLRWGEDFDLWLRLSRHGAAMAVQPEPLVRLRAGSPSAHDDTHFRRALDVLCTIRDRLPLAHPDRDCVDVRIDELRRLLDHRLGHRTCCDRPVFGRTPPPPSVQASSPSKMKA